jgi:hypothetical protein
MVISQSGAPRVSPRRTARDGVGLVQRAGDADDDPRARGDGRAGTGKLGTERPALARSQTVAVTGEALTARQMNTNRRRTPSAILEGVPRFMV